MEEILHSVFNEPGELDWGEYSSSIYYRRDFLKSASIDLLYMSKHFFHSAKIISEIEDYKTKANIGERIQFVNESIIDSIKIVLCFENYMKAKLLMSNYVIHEIINRRKRNFLCIKQKNNLSYKQKEEPISIAELIKVQPYIINKNRVPILNTITKKTLAISTLLKPKYQTIIGLPNPVIHILGRHIKLRNEIHFCTLASFLEDPVKDISTLKHFVDNDITNFSKTLV